MELLDTLKWRYATKAMDPARAATTIDSVEAPPGQQRPRHAFEATGDDQAAFQTHAHRFLGPEVSHVETFETGTIPTIGLP